MHSVTDEGRTPTSCQGKLALGPRLALCTWLHHGHWTKSSQTWFLPYSAANPPASCIHNREDPARAWPGWTELLGHRHIPPVQGGQSGRTGAEGGGKGGCTDSREANAMKNADPGDPSPALYFCSYDFIVHSLILTTIC